MMVKIVFLICFLLIGLPEIRAQCGSGIISFPCNEGFEASDRGWVSGAVGSDWAWGSPSKPVISAAGGGTKCRKVGGLSGGPYINAEASWLQTPCFDFNAVQYPYIEFKLFWEMEQQFDGGSLKHSIDNGRTPDNNGKNDGFGPLGILATLTDYKFNDYNRWGDRCFHQSILLKNGMAR